MAVKNTYKVPKKKWRKWGPVARDTFNRLYYTMKNNQYIMLHPQQDKITARLWKTTCWNAAWLAADFCEEGIRGQS